MKKNTIIMGVLLFLGAITIGSMTLMTDSSEVNERQESSSSARATDTESDKTTEETNQVSMQDFDFAPKNILVKKGTTVTWTNNDSAHHNVEFVSGGLKGEKGPLLDEGETYTYTFDEVGTFEYKCTPHPFMQASVTVEE